MSPTHSPRSPGLPRLDRALMLAAVAVMGACESPTAPGIAADPLLQTADGVHSFEPVAGGAQELTVPYTFTNRTPGSISLGNCNGVFSHGLERLTDRGWERSWSSSLLLCHSEPIQIVPGATWTGEVVVRAVSSSTALSGSELPLAADLAGTYRVVWDLPVTEAPGGEEVLAKDLRVSNSFEVRLP